MAIGLLFIAIVVAPYVVDSLRFDVNAYSKCIGEEIQQGVLVVGDYFIVTGSEPPHDRITVKVSSPYGAQMHWQDSVERGQFGFTTKESGQYMACFWIPHASPGAHPLSVELDWKIGVAATDWNEIAKKEHLDGIELEIRRLEDALHAIRKELGYFKDREIEMRNLNEVANTRVATLSIFSLLVCIALAGWQLWHLKTYFERKKLL